jgi:hypothetical protein
MRTSNVANVSRSYPKYLAKDLVSNSYGLLKKILEKIGTNGQIIFQLNTEDTKMIRAFLYGMMFMLGIAMIIDQVQNNQLWLGSVINMFIGAILTASIFLGWQSIHDSVAEDFSDK